MEERGGKSEIVTKWWDLVQKMLVGLLLFTIFAPMNKKDILRYLIGSNAFAASPSAFSRTIGYSGSATVQRIIKDNEAKLNDGRAVDSIWEMMKKSFGWDDESLYFAWRVMICTNTLYEDLKNYHKDEWSEAWMIDAFVALLNGKYDVFCKEFRKEYEFTISNARKGEKELFYRVMAGLFLKTKGYDFYKRNKFKDVLVEAIDDVNEILRKEYAINNTEGQKMAERMKGVQMLNTAITNKYGAISYLSSLLTQYADPDAWLKMATDDSRVYDWGWMSYWIKPESSPKNGEEFWCAITVVSDGDNGFYNLYHCYVKDGNADCDAVCRMLFEEEDDDKTIMTVCTLPEMYKSVQQELRYYEVTMNEDCTRLSFNINDDNHFRLPPVLKMYDTSTLNHNEKGWEEIIERYIETNAEPSQRKQVAAAAGIEVLDFEDGEYRIDDVFIGRVSIVIRLFVAKDGKTHHYRINRDKYQLLDHITPDDDVLVCKHIGDEKVYIEWTTPSFFVALEEFEEV